MPITGKIWQFQDAQEIEVSLIEQIITGTRHPELQNQLLSKDETLTLEEALSIFKIHEAL